MPAFMITRLIKAAREDIFRKKLGTVEKPKPEADLSQELDDIFSDLKKTRKKKAAEEAQRKAAEANKPKQRKFTEDGLPIYTEDELQMNNPKAGTTPLCPFDCDCCH